jgi:AbrB family transcriptional regulator (stage V sporulation protein T)
MKSTGVIRRIDDLGRIVIPKEIRKNLRIKDGDNLEIFISSEDLVLKKYSYLKKITDLSQELTDTLSNYLKKTVLITDNDTVIAASGKYKNEYLNKNISNYLVECIKRRQSFIEINKKKIEFIDNHNINCNYILSTIIVNSEALGSIIIFSEEEILKEEEFKIANIASSFISKYLE